MNLVTFLRHRRFQCCILFETKRLPKHPPLLVLSLPKKMSAETKVGLARIPNMIPMWPAALPARALDAIYNSSKWDRSPTTLKVFMAPEFFFRGPDGAYRVQPLLPRQSLPPAVLFEAIDAFNNTAGSARVVFFFMHMGGHIDAAGMQFALFGGGLRIFF